MRSLLFVTVVLSLVFASCENREDSFEAENEKPVMTIKRSDSIEYRVSLYDTIKIGESFSIDILIEDDDRTSLTSLIKGIGEISFKSDGQVAIYKDYGTGINEITIIATDYFGETDSTTALVFAFENYLPVADFTLTKTSAETFSIDATKSYDIDAKWGGEVSSMEYKLNDQVYIPLNKLTANVNGSPGANTVSVRVKDNSGEWSEVVVKTITL